ncbi:hypothetical protein GCM10010377_77500 [Streptomyces viridiviolaceus]|uniref:Multi-ubiquitin domain-containing protein n=1 Tax=Streptomyces viridiviolaceus TaxID=68282 RepID=A0ABW2E4V2_9ACTN|nr:hypothetical protein [Streptomyces viridiviolaceus]GHB75606.1 hypothetical protein GCM10010377_77500 [Streptomyces viridiviolaceus]
MTTADTQHQETKDKTVTVTVDGEPVTGVPKRTTPNAILGLAAIDAGTHYLVRITGRHQHSFAGRGEEEISVHERETFVSVSTGPTPTA